MFEDVALAKGQTVLVVLPESLLHDGKDWQAKHQESGASTELVSVDKDGEAMLAFAPASVDLILAAGDGNVKLDQLFEKFLTMLKPGGKFIVEEVLQETPQGDSKTESELQMALMIGGFIDTQISYIDVDNQRRLQAVSIKPAESFGTTATLSLKPKKTATKTWKIIADDAEDEEVDEDALLEGDKAVINTTPEDCGVGAKKRACKNCSCGLKEQQAGEEVEVDLKQKVSSCGNCYKGDAFRCGSCPFLGKPAFQPGMEKVMLDLGGDDETF